MLKQAVISFICMFVLVSCEDTYETINICVALPDIHKHQEDTIIKDTTLHFYYSRLSKPNSRGLQCDYILPNEFIENELEIVFSGKIRTNYAHSNSYINVAAMSSDGAVINWSGQLLKYYVTDTDQWCPFKDSIHLKPEAWNKPFHFISTFAFLGNSIKENMDLDSLIVQIKIKK